VLGEDYKITERWNPGLGAAAIHL